MSLLRVELVSAGREHTRRLLARYRDGGHDRDLESRAYDEAERLGRTPSGRPILAGATNGNPALLLVDVPVASDASADRANRP